MMNRNTRNVPAPHRKSLGSGAIGFGIDCVSPASPVVVASDSSAAKRIDTDPFPWFVTWTSIGQANFRRMKATKPMRASASVKAAPRNIVVRTMPADSG